MKVLWVKLDYKEKNKDRSVDTIVAITNDGQALIGVPTLMAEIIKDSIIKNRYNLSELKSNYIDVLPEEDREALLLELKTFSKNSKIGKIKTSVIGVFYVEEESLKEVLFNGTKEHLICAFGNVLYRFVNNEMMHGIDILVNINSEQTQIMHELLKLQFTRNLPQSNSLIQKGKLIT